MRIGVTVAIPTYNRGRILVETLQRLTALEPPAGEIVVVDQTRDHPAEVERALAEMETRGDIVLIRLERPSIPHAMNVALQRARHPRVLFVDDDVDPPPGLAAAHEAAYGDPGVWAVVGQVLQPGERSEHFDERSLRAGPLRDLEFRFNHDTPCDVESTIACNLSVDRERALAIGGFDENFTGAAYRFETDFARRVVDAGGRVRFEPAASLRHLRVPTGGVRSYGGHLVDASPAHSAGDYYFALHHARRFWRYALRRFVRNVATRYHARHPWTIPAKVVGELRGLFLARRLFRAGRRLADRGGSEPQASLFGGKA